MRKNLVSKRDCLTQFLMFFFQSCYVLESDVNLQGKLFCKISQIGVPELSTLNRKTVLEATKRRN